MDPSRSVTTPSSRILAKQASNPVLKPRSSARRLEPIVIHLDATNPGNLQTWSRTELSSSIQFGFRRNVSETWKRPDRGFHQRRMSPANVSKTEASTPKIR
eukprot:357349-Amphidinium_carterae.1